MDPISAREISYLRRKDSRILAQLAVPGRFQLHESLRRYIAFSGPVFLALRERVRRTLFEQARSVVPGLLLHQMFDANWTIRESFLAERFPDLAGSYFDPASLGEFTALDLIPEGPNEHRDTVLPPPISRRSHWARRPAFRVYTARGGELFVSAAGFQYFDSRRGVYWPDACSVGLSRAALAHPTVAVDMPVVLIQDHFDGSNFSHFLFDYATRLMLFIESGIERPQDCVFIMGGEPGHFQRTIISAICAMTGLGPENFYFPTGKVILRTSSRIHLFSNQKQAITHSAHMGHPRAIEVLRRIGAALDVAPGTVSRVYISRSDARVRRIANEGEFRDDLERRGFKILRLAELRLEEQIALIGGASCIVAPHGMGLTHIGLHQGRPRILELFNPQKGLDTYSFVARGLGFDYRPVIGTEMGNPEMDFRIDPAALAEALQHSSQSP